MDQFIAKVEALVDEDDTLSTAEVIAALELVKSSLVLSCLTADGEDDAEA